MPVVEFGKLGTQGALVKLLNSGEPTDSLVNAYLALGWTGILLQLSEMRKTPKVKEAMRESAWFSFGKFYLWYCDYKGRIHFFAAPSVGRRPLACPIHAKAARRARWYRGYMAQPYLSSEWLSEHPIQEVKDRP
jgi:hypothetical protein